MLKLFIVLTIFSAALLYIWLEDNMPGSKQDAADAGATLTQETLQKFKALRKSAFIVGYTGETGKELTRAVVQSGAFERVVLVGRRQVDYSGDALLKNVEQVVVDFEKIENHADVFKNIDVGFSCFGTTRMDHSAAEFVKVDYDYVVNTARVAKEAGVQDYQLVTTMGANKDSYFLYGKTKGRAEHALSEMGFNRLTLIRPGFLWCDRVEHRTVEKVFKFVMTPLFKMMPTLMSVPTRTVGLAMLYRAIVPANASVEYVENAQIHQLASKVALFDKAA